MIDSEHASRSNDCTDAVVSRQVLADPDHALNLEWLVTDGTGAYACASVLGCNTRRYHGLLVAARRPPQERCVLLAAVEEHVEVNGRTRALSVTEYPDVLHPDGYRRLAAFRYAPQPQWLFHDEGLLLTKTVSMIPGRSAVSVRYEVAAAPEAVTLWLVPQFACRGFHQLNRDDVRGRAESMDGGALHVRGGNDELDVFLRLSRGEWRPRDILYRNVWFRREAERGFDCREDWFTVAACGVTLAPGEGLMLTAAAEPSNPQPPKTTRVKGRPAAHKTGSELDSPLVHALARAANAFLVGGGGGDAPRNIIAGYPWFDCWGRDAFIALEGLALVTGRLDDALAVLETFADRIRDGIIPNYLAADPEEDALNSVDAGLWWIHAAGRYMAWGGKPRALRKRVWPGITDVLRAYRQGTRHNIHADDDGLLIAGSADTQLTWMDAVAQGRPVTPRHGKAVEVNALWYNALLVGADLAERLKQPAMAREWRTQAERAGRAFNNAFWCEKRKYLYDVVEGERHDARLRPNQILAVSLPCPVLARERWPAVLEAVRQGLYTPFGLRTLAPDDAEYRGTYTGGPDERDAAYHQGCVWGWLLGPWYEAVLKTGHYSAAARAEVNAGLGVWPGHLSEEGLGSVSEIFDGDAPHRPRGCIAQAWSVAELLRIARLVKHCDNKT